MSAKMHISVGFLILAGAFSGPNAIGQNKSVDLLSPAGIWQTIDDKTHKVRGTVRIYEQQGEFFAKIESSVDPKEAADICDLCRDDRKNQPILGLVIMRRMKKAGDEWTGGDVLDPDSGLVYKGKMRLTEGGKKLVLRGYVGVSLLGRSQVWQRD